MFPTATDLAEGDPLPDDDEIARYCKPSEYDHNNHSPKVGAFVRRPNEDDLSVNRLQFFSGRSREGAVDCVQREVGSRFGLKPTGRFVVLGVVAIKIAVLKRGCGVAIIYTPKPCRPSHSSMIFELPEGYDDEVKVATALVRLVTQDNTYEVAPENVSK